VFCFFLGGVCFRVRRAKRSVNPVTEKKKSVHIQSAKFTLVPKGFLSLSPTLLPGDPYRIHVEAGHARNVTAE
jgi:hypothetical protein